MKKQTIDLLIIGNFGHQVADDLLYYLLLKKLEYGVMCIPKSGKPCLYGISFEVAQLQRAYPSLRVKPLMPVAEILKLHVGQHMAIGIRPSALPLSVSDTMRKKKIKWHEFSHRDIIATKLPEEIRRMQKAAHLTDVIFSRLIRSWKKFRTEQDAARYIIGQCFEEDVEPSFAPIIASGAKAADPHHESAMAPLTRGFCVIDMGVRMNGYCSDMTRTIFLGMPTKQEAALYAHVKKIQDATIQEVRAGVSTKTIDEYCRNILGDTLNKQFIHGLGHGVGTQVHEWPGVTKKEDATLREGMIITIEPGIYKKGSYGIRIEDDVLVTKKRPVVLTQMAKKLITI